MLAALGITSGVAMATESTEAPKTAVIPKDAIQKEQIFVVSFPPGHAPISAKAIREIKKSIKEEIGQGTMDLIFQGGATFYRA